MAKVQLWLFRAKGRFPWFALKPTAPLIQCGRKMCSSFSLMQPRMSILLDMRANTYALVSDYSIRRKVESLAVHKLMVKYCVQFFAPYLRRGHFGKRNDLRKHVLVGRKTERIVFAVTPEMKSAMERITSEKGTSVSAMLTQLATDEVLANAELFEESE